MLQLEFQSVAPQRFQDSYGLSDNLRAYAIAGQDRNLHKNFSIR
jgi:hypothetical protein